MALSDDKMDKKFGYEVQLNSFETVCLFLGCKVKMKDKNSDRLHEYCMVSAAERFPLDPKKGEIYGVFLQSTQKWTRGKLKEIYNHVDATKYLFFLIDIGHEELVTKQYMVKLNAYTDYPPMCMRIGLYGYLPDVALCKKCIFYLTDILHKGLIYLKEKQTINRMVFGRIVIVPHNKSEPIDLAIALLNKGLVKESDNFESDVVQFYSKFKGLKEDLDFSLKNETPDKIIESKSHIREILTKQEVYRDRSNKISRKSEGSSMEIRGCRSEENSVTRSQNDTGYSSDDDHNKTPFVHEDAIFVPAGYHPQPKKTEKKYSKKEEIHIPRSYYQIIRDKENAARKGKEIAQRQNKNVNRDLTRTRSSHILCGKQEINQERTESQQPRVRQPHNTELEGPCPEKSSKKQVTWGNTVVQANNNKPERNISEPKTTRAFHLNLKSSKKAEDENVSGSIEHEDKTNSESGSCSRDEIKHVTLETSNSLLSTTVLKTNLYQNQEQTEQASTNRLLSGTGNAESPALTKKQRLKLKQSMDEMKSLASIQNGPKAGLISDGLNSAANEENQHSRKDQSTPASNTDQTTDASSSQTHSSNPVHVSNMTKKQLLKQKYKSEINVNKTKENLLETNQCSGGDIVPKYSISTPSISEGSSFSSNNVDDSKYSNISTNSSSTGTLTESVIISKDSINITNNQNQSTDSLNTFDSSIHHVSEASLGTDIKLTKKQILKLKYKNELSNVSNKICPSENLTNNTKRITVLSDKNLVADQVSQQEQNCTVQKSICEKNNEDRMQIPCISYTSDGSFHENHEIPSKVFSEEEEKRKRLNNFMAPDKTLIGTEENYFPEMKYPERLRNNIANNVLLHTSDDCSISPVTTLSESCLDPTIIKRMEQLQLREMSRIQPYTYSSICARRNVVMISGPKSGKIAAYTVPLASNLLDPEWYLQLPQGSGPRAIVVTPYWQSGGYVAELFHDLTSELKVIHTYGGGAELEKRVEILNGCDLLVSTPKCLMRLLECEVTDLTRLCHIVLDDADILLEKFSHEIKMFIVHTDKMQQDRERKNLNLEVQVVLSSSTWTAPLEKLVTCNLVNPTICIASQLEACVYAGIKPTAVFVDGSRKMEKLVEILKKVEGKKRAVVVCNNKTDVKHVYTLLLDLGVRNVIGAHEDLTSVNISEIPNFWYKDVQNINTIWERSVSLPILVTSDEVLDEFPISNAQVLVHFNMPASLKTFSLRFACLMANYRNVLKKEPCHKKCEVFILIDEENDLELPDLMKFMVRLGTTLPNTVQDTLEKIEDLQQKKKMSEQLCEDLKQFGRCWNIKSCSYRHILVKELDFVENIPKNGLVKILVQNVHNACHFSARLLEHAENNDQWKKLPNEMMVLSVKMNNYYGKANNQKLHGRVSVGDMVAFESSPDVFHRAVVLKVTKFNKNNEAVAVNIRLIDNGQYQYEIRVVHLYNLPEELKVFPPGVVDVYLCNLMPKDLDISWSVAMKNWVEGYIQEARRNRPNGYMFGKIVLSFGRNIWLDPVQYKEYLPTLDTTVIPFSLRTDLLSSNNAVDNPDHITSLKKLCNKAGIEVQEEFKIKKKPNLPKPDWAWLPSDVNEVVYVVSIQSPTVIFVRLSYLCDKVEELEKEIQAFVKKQDSCDYSKLLDVGDVCLGKFPEGDRITNNKYFLLGLSPAKVNDASFAGERPSKSWSRAIINSKPEENQVELFFVDYGDLATVSWSDVAPISSELITKLPFQAIECYLAGIKFPDTGNIDQEDVIDSLVSLTRNTNEVAVNLLVKVLDVEPVGVMSKGRKYKVILFDHKNHGTINKQLVSAGFALLVNEEKHLLEDQTDMKVEDISVIESDTGLNEDMKVTTVVQYKNKCDVLLPEDFSLSDTVAADEKDRRIQEFLRDVESGRCEYSGFYSEQSKQVSDNDADISENHSEGSLLSIPQSSGSLLLQIKHKESTEYNESTSSQSSTISSSSSRICEKKSCYNHLTPSIMRGGNENSEEAEFNPQDLELKKFVSSDVQCSQNVSVVFESKNSDEEQNRSLTDIEERDDICHELHRNHRTLKYTSTPHIDSCNNGTSNDYSFNGISPINLSSKVPLNVTIPYDQFYPLAYRSPTTSSVKSKFYTDLLSPKSLESGSPNCKLNLVEKMKPFLRHVSNANSNYTPEDCDDDDDDDVSMSENVSNDPNFSDINDGVLDSSNLEKTEPENTIPKDEYYTKLTESATPERVEMLCGVIDNNSSTLEISRDPSHSHSSTGTIVKYKEKSCKHFEDTDKERIGKSNLNRQEDYVTPQDDSEASATSLRIECSLEEITECQARYPLVLWHQNEDNVWIHIKLPSVSHYKFTCDIDSFEFRALYNQLPYMVNLQLFGAHKHEMVQYTSKAFHFEIRLEKILKGKKYNWPRLTKKNEKLHWLKINVEKASEYIEESEDEDVKQLACSLPHWNDDPQISESLSTESSEENNSELSISLF